MLFPKRVIGRKCTARQKKLDGGHHYAHADQILPERNPPGQSSARRTRIHQEDHDGGSKQTDVGADADQSPTGLRTG